MDLRTKTPVPDVPDKGLSVGRAPCVFCGKLIGHVNDYRYWRHDEFIGCVAGAVVDGQVKHFIYCNEPPCKDRLEAEQRGEGVRTCSCEGYRAYDVLGDLCHVCKKTPQGECPWCEKYVPETADASVLLQGTNKNDGRYCSSDCLFHKLLSDRTDEDAFTRVQEIINLPAV